MSIRQQIFMLRVKRIARHNIHRAIDMLRAVGATLQQAVRFCVLARAA